MIWLTSLYAPCFYNIDVFPSQVKSMISTDAGSKAEGIMYNICLLIFQNFSRIYS